MTALPTSPSSFLPFKDPMPKKKAISLVRTRHGCACCERQDRYDVLLYEKRIGQLYFNVTGYVGTLPTPEGSMFTVPESSIAMYQREAATLNREFAEAGFPTTHPALNKVQA